MDLATQRIEVFGTMELSRRDGHFDVAADAKQRLEGLGIRVRYTRTRWPKEARCARKGAADE